MLLNGVHCEWMDGVAGRMAGWVGGWLGGWIDGWTGA